MNESALKLIYSTLLKSGGQQCPHIEIQHVAPGICFKIDIFNCSVQETWNSFHSSKLCPLSCYKNESHALSIDEAISSLLPY